MTKAENSTEKKLRELYSKFQSPEFRKDLENCVKTRGGKNMEYIPWSNVMDRFFKACPGATYEFQNYYYQLNDDGIECRLQRPFMGDSKHGYFVATSITCYGVTRSMTSAIYGSNFTQANLKPTANQVHNAQMRCLCKNAAMFGLGIELWTREEIAQLEAEDKNSEEPPKEEEKPKAKVTKENWKPSDGAPKLPEEKTLPEQKMEEILEFALELYQGEEVTPIKLKKNQLKIVDNKLNKLGQNIKEKFLKKHHLGEFENVKEFDDAVKRL